MTAKPSRLLLLAAALVAIGNVAGTTAAANCTAGNLLDSQQSLLARYLYELRNNRQLDCGPPDFAEDFPNKESATVSKLCTAPGALPSDTYTNVTLTFKNTCKDGNPEQKLQLDALVRQCAGGDPTLQPWAADSVRVALEPLPDNFTCPAGLVPIPVVDDEIDFTPMWEMNHLCENSLKYKLFPSDPSAVPQCGGSAWLGTSFEAGCYSNETGRYEGYCNILFSCDNGTEANVSVAASATLLPGGREACPWPMLLPGTDGYRREFDFLDQTMRGGLANCLKSAGVEFLDSSDPLALDAASEVWNKLNTTVAVAVAYPANEDQVAAAVLCAAEAGIKPVARSGGHSYMGYSVLSDGLTIDLNRMNSTQLAADGNTATVQAGSRLGQLYYWVDALSNGTKAAVGGTCPTVGTGGLIQGGGIGFLTRQHGLACDQVEEIHMVDAAGKLVVANSSQNAQLLAATCGAGGGNMGIVTQYRIKVFDSAPNYTIAGYTVVAAQAIAYLNFIQSTWLPRANASLALQVNIDKGTVIVGVQYPGSKAATYALLRSEGLLGPSWNVTGESYTEMPWIQTVMYNAFYPEVVKVPADLLKVKQMEKQYRTYFKLKSFFAEKALTDAAWKTMIEWEAKIDKYGGYIEMDMLQGAVAAVPVNATGFVHRGALFSIQYGAEWEREVDTNRAIPLIDQMQAALDPFFEPDGLPAYINYLDVQVGPDPMQSYYGANGDWLQQVKATYDPDNLFTSNPLAIRAAASPNDTSTNSPPPPAPALVGVPPVASPSTAPTLGPEDALSPELAPSPELARSPELSPGLEPAPRPTAADRSPALPPDVAPAPAPTPAASGASSAQSCMTTQLLAVLMAAAVLVLVS